MENKEFWKQRTIDLKNEFSVASNDTILKEIELECINKFLPKDGRILEVGCGNGYNLKRIDREGKILTGVDFVPEMIELAKKDNEKGVDYKVRDALDLGFENEFDAVFTNRCVINIEPHEQGEAVENIAKALKKGGRYIFLEQILENQNKINRVRKKLGLSVIPVPEQNYYIDYKDIQKAIDENFVVEKKSNPSSMYYFFSRVINAYVKKEKNMHYDDIINRIGALLPQFGTWGTLDMLILRKR